MSHPTKVSFRAMRCLGCGRYDWAELARGGSFAVAEANVDSVTRKDEVVVLTGFASITTAIEAIKLGAVYYLVKPVTISQILAAFRRTQGNATVPLSRKPAPFEALEWEYLNQVLVACKGNVSATARRLGMHRRTLQRKLSCSPH
ncbi:MAG: response regulator transcription factor [Gammaproteobacteria bacterium]